MADYTQVGTPLKFPREAGDGYITGGGSLQDGDTLLYTETQVRYVYDATSGTWTGATGDLDGIDGFPDIPGSFPGKDGQYFADGDLQLAKSSSGPWSQGPVNSSAGDTIHVRWDPTTYDRAHLSLIEGSVSYVAFGTTLAQSFAAYNLLRVPTNEMSASIGNTSYNSDIKFPTGLPKGYGLVGETTFVYINASDSSSVKLETSSGGSTTAVRTKLVMEKGDTFTVTHQSSGTASTTTTTSVYFTDNIETTAGVPYEGGTFVSETTNVSPSIETPTIVTPVDGAINLKPEFELTSSTYTPQNGAGPHASSDWETYEGSFPLTSKNQITAIDTESESTWSSSTIPLYYPHNTIYAEGYVFVAGYNSISSNQTSCYKSNNGLLWTKVGPGVNGTTRGQVAYGNGILLLGAGDNYYTSTDLGDTWSSLKKFPELSPGNSELVRKIKFIDGKFIFLGNTNIFTSVDAETWSKPTINMNDSDPTVYNDVTSNGTTLCAVHSTNSNATPALSTDGGLTWNHVDRSGLTGFMRNSQQTVTWNGTYFFSGSAIGPYASRSLDGVNWENIPGTPTLGGGESRIECLFSDYSGAVYLGGNRIVARSTDNGATWTQLPSFSNQRTCAGAATPLFNIYCYMGSPGFGDAVTSTPEKTVLTIAKTPIDGFRVGDVVNDCGSSDDAIVTNLTNSTMSLLGTPSGFDIGDNVCRGSGTYGLIDQDLNSTDLTSHVIDESKLKTKTEYYSRVKYRSNDPVESEWSDFSGFTTSNSFLPDPGDPFGGGYFVGQVLGEGNTTDGLDDLNVVYNLIISSNGSFGNVSGTAWDSAGVIGTKSHWLTVSDLTDAEVQPCGCGSRSTTYMANRNSTRFDLAAPWCAYDPLGPNAGTYDLSGSSNGTGLGGYNDWYVPAKDEINLLFFYLKPTTDAITPGSGSSGSLQFTANPTALPPYGRIDQLAVKPTQTTVAAFQEGGAECLGIPGKYRLYSASKGGGRDAGNINEWWTMTMDSGSMWYMTGNLIVRAVRRQRA